MSIWTSGVIVSNRYFPNRFFKSTLMNKMISLIITSVIKHDCTVSLIIQLKRYKKNLMLYLEEFLNTMDIRFIIRVVRGL